jgi:hypothetical protein
MPIRTIFIISIAFIAGVLAMDAQNRLTEGARPYSPTRLQWLVLDTEARAGVRLSADPGFSLDFANIEAENTVLIYVRYLPTANREIMNAEIETARKLIAITAKAEGWTGWLKIREDVKMAESAAN